MRVMIAVIILLVVSVLSLTMLPSSGSGQMGKGDQLEASVNSPTTK
jgi:hypothetical protein